MVCSASSNYNHQKELNYTAVSTYFDLLILTKNRYHCKQIGLKNTITVQHIITVIYSACKKDQILIDTKIIAYLFFVDDPFK
ncbi:protein of unknown function [Cardinium endosymbiont cEper1 of Encarsia pergandiella]|nr:protein of unknown function [Cardinium endosymbiont cEper1 of Encarsia pergandiella]